MTDQEVTGEGLAAELARLPDTVAELSRQVLYEVTLEVYEGARKRVSVRTGRLEKSIGATQGRKGLELAGDSQGPAPQKLPAPRLMQNVTSAARLPGARGYSDLVEGETEAIRQSVAAAGENIPAHLQAAFSKVFGAPE